MRRVSKVRYLQIFGSRAFVLNKKIIKDKFGANSMKSIFVGYLDEAKAYQIWMLNDRKIVITKDVKFIDVNKKFLRRWRYHLKPD